MKRLFASLLLTALPVVAQQESADAQGQGVLQNDPANDRYQRAKNLYDAALEEKDADRRGADLERAAEIFSGYLAEFPNHENAEPAWYYLGQSHYQSGNKEEGKRCFNTLLARYKNGRWAAAAAYTIGADYYNRREYAQALPLFERYADQTPAVSDQARGHFLVANCQRLLNRDREAAANYQQVLDSPEAGQYAIPSQLALGQLNAKANKTTEALALFRAVADSDAETKLRGEAALGAALAAIKLGDEKTGQKYLDFLLSTPGMDDLRGQAQITLMANCYAQKRYKEVIEIFKRGEFQGKQDEEGERLMLAARSHLKLKQYSEALTLFRNVEQVFKGKPQNDLAFDASYHRLLCYYQLDAQSIPTQVDDFLKIYQRSRSNDARIHSAMLMKADTLFSQKKMAEAAKMYGTIDAAKINPQTMPAFLLQRGWCLAEAGDPQGAIRSLDKFIGDYPTDPRLLSAVGKRASAYAAAGETAKAFADFDRLAKEGDGELMSFALLESARLRRSDGHKIDDMVTRYQALLDKAPKLDDGIRAEANYWIGWGQVKLNRGFDATRFLETARKLRPQTYSKHAGLLLALAYWSAQDAEKLGAEIDLAIRQEYSIDFPQQALQWAGIQTFNTGTLTGNAAKIADAARYLQLVANYDEPRETSKEVWRYLAKAHVATGKAQEALNEIEHFLAVEDNAAWGADALHDKARALLALKREADARAVADQALAMHAQGRIGGNIRILCGDLALLEDKTDVAIAHYNYVLELIEDRDLKPLAIYKLAQAYMKKGDSAEADQLKQKLAAQFPNWQPPAF